jgi:hypothetical protein
LSIDVTKFRCILIDCKYFCPIIINMDWKERMRREAREESESQGQAEKRKELETEGFIREHSKGPQDRLYEATLRELKDLERVLKAKDIRDQVAKIWGGWKIRKYDDLPNNGLGVGSVNHKGRDVRVYYLRGSVDITTGVDYEITHKVSHSGTKGYWQTHVTLGGQVLPDGQTRARSYTSKLDKPIWHPPTPDHTSVTDYSSRFQIKTGKTISEQEERLWVAVSDTIPSYRSHSRSIKNLRLEIGGGNLQLVTEQVQEFSYQATKWRAENDTLPAIIEDILRGKRACCKSGNRQKVF